jgi:dolichol-phosphate mannosyltransferase
LPIAWRAFADAAEEIADRVEVVTGHQPLLVGMDTYFLASELAFYRHDRDSVENTTSRGLFRSGGLSSGLMYDYWPSGQQQNGRTVIMFDFEPEGVSDNSISTWFQELGPVRERIVYKAGAPAGRFYYRVGRGFRPSLHSAIPAASQDGTQHCALSPCGQGPHGALTHFGE